MPNVMQAKFTSEGRYGVASFNLGLFIKFYTFLDYMWKNERHSTYYCNCGLQTIAALSVWAYEILDRRGLAPSSDTRKWSLMKQILSVS